MSSNDGLAQLQAALHDARTAIPAVIVGSLLLGVFTLLLAFSAYILRHKGLRARSHVAMLVVVALMYAIATISWAVTVASLIQAVERPEVYALLDAHSISTKGAILLICQGLNFWLSDIIVTWRTWILWSDRARVRRVVAGVPCALFVGVVVCGLIDLAVDLGSNAVDLPYPASRDLGYYNAPSPLYVSFSGKLGTIFSAILNVWCVVLTAVKSWQFWKLQKLAGRGLYDSQVGMALVLLAFCGSTYCVFWIYWVAVSIRNLGPNLNATLLLCNNAAAVQINGIYPTFVIVSASLHKVNAVDGQHTPISPFRAAVRNSQFGSTAPLFHGPRLGPTSSTE